MTSANSLSTLGCQPLGPVDLNISGLLRFRFTHPSPSPSWMPVPAFKPSSSLSGYPGAFWKTAFIASVSSTLTFSFMIINGERTIFFWSLWFTFKWSTLFSYIYLVKKGKWKPQIYLAIIWIFPSHCWIHVLATLYNRALVNILQTLRMLMTAYLMCKGNFCIWLVQ